MMATYNIEQSYQEQSAIFLQRAIPTEMERKTDKYTLLQKVTAEKYEKAY